MRQETPYVDLLMPTTGQITRKSTTGCVFTCKGAPVVWISKRQTCIALSSTESEYIALAHAGKEAMWISRIYRELGVESLENNPISLKTDSQSAIKPARNPEHCDVLRSWVLKCMWYM